VIGYLPKLDNEAWSFRILSSQLERTVELGGTDLGQYYRVVTRLTADTPTGSVTEDEIQIVYCSVDEGAVTKESGTEILIDPWNDELPSTAEMSSVALHSMICYNGVPSWAL